MDRVVVVGGGPAGYRALQVLKDFAGEVVLVSADPHMPYDRPPLSKQALTGERDDVTFKTDGMEVEWRLDTVAEALDTGAQRLTLAGGEELAYDGLILAPGRRAREWPDRPDLPTLRTIDDARRLQAAAQGAKRVAIVGAGFIGCEVAASLHKLGVEEITLIEMADQPLAPLGKDAGAFIQRVHEEHGVRFILGATVTGFEGDSRVCLDDDEEVEADFVLVALGAVPNTEWLSGLDLHRGAMVCDEHLFVAENVVAAGDAVAWRHPHSDEPVSIEHWNTSRELAKAAAENLVGERQPFAGVPSFWSDQYDLKINSCGLLSAADRFEVVSEEDGKLAVEAHRGDELVGAVVVNDVRAFAGYRRQLEDALSDN